MKLSARNQLRGTVKEIKQGTVMAEVVIGLDNGVDVVAAITLGSGQALGLDVGTPVYAVVKATDVLLATEGEPNLVLSARNQFAATVKEIKSGIVTAEVLVAVAGGTEMVAVITEGSVQSLGLVAGTSVTVVIKATEVLVATLA